MKRFAICTAAAVIALSTAAPVLADDAPKTNDPFVSTQGQQPLPIGTVGLITLGTVVTAAIVGISGSSTSSTTTTE
ncbi:MAG: hypothetical protein AAGA28_06995 [Pseudomonadota bacterium]